MLPLIIVLLLLFILCFILFRMPEYIVESRYIKLEIKRSEGKEREHWKHRLKKLRIRTFLFFR